MPRVRTTTDPARAAAIQEARDLAEAFDTIAAAREADGAPVGPARNRARARVRALEKEATR